MHADHLAEHHRAALGSWPFSTGSSMVRQYLHSSATGDSFTRGGFTRVLGAGVRPASFNSSTPNSTMVVVTFICSLRLSLTMLTTNSPVDSAFMRLCLVGVLP